MQLNMPALLSDPGADAPWLEDVLDQEAIHRGACVQAALVLLTQFTPAGGEIFTSDVLLLARFMHSGKVDE